VTRRDVASRLAVKLLTPIVASTASAATSYAMKRAPDLLETHVLPRFRGGTNGAAPVSRDNREQLRKERAAGREARRARLRKEA
jgi:diadenosine tetraphosphate (Ap4A) HIT family hydrolase